MKIWWNQAQPLFMFYRTFWLIKLGDFWHAQSISCFALPWSFVFRRRKWKTMSPSIYIHRLILHRIIKLNLDLKQVVLDITHADTFFPFLSVRLCKGCVCINVMGEFQRVASNLLCWSDSWIYSFSSILI